MRFVIILLLLVLISMQFSCSKQEGEVFQDSLRHPFHTDLDMDEAFRIDLTDHAEWSGSTKVTFLNYQGKQPLTFIHSDSVFLYALDFQSRSIKWVVESSSPLVRPRLYDYDEQLIWGNAARFYVCNSQTGGIIRSFDYRDHLPDSVKVSGFVVHNDIAYIQTYTGPGSNSLMSILKVDPGTLKIDTLMQQNGTQGESLPYNMSVDESGEYLMFTAFFNFVRAKGTWIIQANIHTGNTTYRWAGEEHADELSTTNPFTHIQNTTFYYQARRRIYGLGSNRHSMIWKSPELYRAFFDNDYMIFWRNTKMIILNSHNHEQIFPAPENSFAWPISFPPIIHPRQDIICLLSFNTIALTALSTGRMLYSIDISSITEDEFIQGFILDPSGEHLCIITSDGFFRALKWPF